MADSIEPLTSQRMPTASATWATLRAPTNPPALRQVNGNIVRAPHFHEFQRIVNIPTAFIGNDGNRGLRRDLGHGAQARRGLFHHVHSRLRQPTHFASGILALAVALIRVQSQGHARAEFAPQNRDQPDVAFGIHAAFDLQAGNAIAGGADRLRNRFLLMRSSRPCGRRRRCRARHRPTVCKPASRQSCPRRHAARYQWRIWRMHSRWRPYPWWRAPR